MITERVLSVGEARLSDLECLTLICGPEAASKLLERHSLVELATCEPRELAGLVGMDRALSVHCAFGLSRRLSEVRFRAGMPVREARDVARLVADMTRCDARESFVAVYLDVRHRVITVRTVSTGTLHNAPIHPREVFRPAIRSSAAALIVAHNHPSGDPAPSNDDLEVTERLRKAGDYLGIELLDHVVVGCGEFYSFARGERQALG